MTQMRNRKRRVEASREKNTRESFLRNVDDGSTPLFVKVYWVRNGREIATLSFVTRPEAKVLKVKCHKILATTLYSALHFSSKRDINSYSLMLCLLA